MYNLYQISALRGGGYRPRGGVAAHHGQSRRQVAASARHRKGRLETDSQSLAEITMF